MAFAKGVKCETTVALGLYIRAALVVFQVDEGSDTPHVKWAFHV